jgi:hypothetical protein
MRHRRLPSTAAATWLAMLVAVIGGLHVAGAGALSTPAMTSGDGWATWLARTDPVVSAFAMIRLAALAGAWYVLVVTVLTGLARAVGSGALVAVADWITLPVLRRVLAVTLSAGMATGSLGALATAGGAVAAIDTSTTVSGPDPGSAPVSVAGINGDQGRPPTTMVMHRLPESGGLNDPLRPGAPATSAGSPSTPPPGPSISTAPPTTPPPTTATFPAVGGVGQRTSGLPAPGEWRVAPGQCFWSIADDVLTSARGRAPSDAEIVPYWRRLIEANRAALVDPDNPDLIFPGQVFTIPAP